MALYLDNLLIDKVFCCTADHHLARLTCYGGDPFRFNADNTKLYPLIFVHTEKTASEIEPVPGGGKRFQMTATVEFLDRVDLKTQDVSETQIIAKMLHISMEVFQRVREILKRVSPSVIMEYTSDGFVVCANANTRRYGADVCGWQWGVSFTGLVPISACDNGFDCIDIADCFCAETQPLPRDFCDNVPCATPPPPVVDGDGITVCYAIGGTMVIDNITTYGPGTIFRWYDDGFTLIALTTFAAPNYFTGPILITTQYYVTAVVDECESAQTFLTAIVNPLPIVLIASQVDVPLPGFITLTASGAVTYIWDDLSVNPVRIVVIPIVTTVYTVTGTDGNGCTDTASITITI